MVINIVTVKSGWMLARKAERIAAANKSDYQMNVSHKRRNDVDANCYIDISNCYRGKTKVLDIGYFTHLHENSLEYLNNEWLTLDYIVHMCKRYYEMFKGVCLASARSGTVRVINM